MGSKISTSFDLLREFRPAHPQHDTYTPVLDVPELPEIRGQHAEVAANIARIASSSSLHITPTPMPHEPREGGTIPMGPTPAR